MIGVELDRPCADIVKLALEQGLVLNVTHDNVIRLLPPLVMNETEGRQLVDILAPVIAGFLATGAEAQRSAAAR
jgi:acetylornithine aminotransferase